jgi:hypothetical protein
VGRSWWKGENCAARWTIGEEKGDGCGVGGATCLDDSCASTLDGATAEVATEAKQGGGVGGQLRLVGAADTRVARAHEKVNGRRRAAYSSGQRWKQGAAASGGRRRTSN